MHCQKDPVWGTKLRIQSMLKQYIDDYYFPLILRKMLQHINKRNKSKSTENDQNIVSYCVVGHIIFQDFLKKPVLSLNMYFNTIIAKYYHIQLSSDFFPFGCHLLPEFPLLKGCEPLLLQAKIK